MALKRRTQILIRRFPVHHDRLDDASNMPHFQPQMVGFMGTVTPVLEGPQHTGAMRHHAEPPMPIHLPVTVAFAPRRVLVHAPQPIWDAPLGFVLGMPDWSQGLVHHLLATNDVTRGALEERFEPQNLELFQAGSRLF